MVRSSRDAIRRAGGALALCVVSSAFAHAQNAAIDDLKGKIFDAKMARQQLGKGARYCENLNGKGFYFHIRDRVLDLEDYFHSLENLVKAEVFNPEKRRPWTIEDARERWEEVKKQATDDKQKCELVRSLPELEKKLRALEAGNADADASAGAPTGAEPDKNADADKKN